MSIERSAELLRQALPWMSRQAAGLHPVSYSVWFEYVARTNPPLSAAVDEHLAREGRLDESATHALFARHVADVDPATAQRVVEGMQRVLAGLGETAAATGAHAARFGASLAQLSGALARGDTSAGIDGGTGVAPNGPPRRRLADIVAEVIADTGTMRSQVASLQQRLADSRREIDRLRDEVRRARDEALRDVLTGLSNRRAFDQALAACLSARAADTAQHAIGAARRSGEADSFLPPLPGARGPWLVMSDIDHFGRVNEAHGRPFGDAVLKAVAEAMRGLVPPGATLARVGGEQFSLLLPSIDAEGALALAERVRRHIGSSHIRGPGAAEGERITVSLGVAPLHPGEAAQALVERAARALRRAKDEGRDRVAAA